MAPVTHSQTNDEGRARVTNALTYDLLTDETDRMPLPAAAFPQPRERATTNARYPSISVVIPALNEAENLPFVLPLLPDMVSEVILVDGHSTDGTPEVARRLLPTITIVRQRGRGKGDALRAGFAASASDIIVMLDADGSTDPAEIPLFVETLLAGADFAKGSRFLHPGGSTDLTLLRRTGNRGMSVCANLLFGTRFTDLCYGYNAFWRHCLDHFEVDCKGFEVETLINLRMSKSDLAIVEVPSFEHARIRGESHLRTLRDGWRVLGTILKERANGRSVIKTVTRQGASPPQPAMSWKSPASMEQVAVRPWDALRARS